MLIQTGTLLTVTFGVAVLILPVIGVWFLWKNTQFVRNANRLAAELDAEGGLPVDELRRTPSGRVDRDSADEVFARRKAETEAAPDDWRSWFRLAVAYHDARDTPRARKAMQRAIALHDGKPVRGPARGLKRAGRSAAGPFAVRAAQPRPYSAAHASTLSAARSNASVRPRKSALCVVSSGASSSAARSRRTRTSACP